MAGKMTPAGTRKTFVAHRPCGKILLSYGFLRSGNSSLMGVSQTAVREALRGLASTGVIEVSPGRGAFERSISPEMLIHPSRFC